MKLMIEAPDDVVEYARRIAKCREKKEVNDDTKYREDVREASLWGQMIGIRRMNINTHILYRSMICIGNGIEVKEDDTITKDKIKDLIYDIDHIPLLEEYGPFISDNTDTDTSHFSHYKYKTVHRPFADILKDIKSLIYKYTGVRREQTDGNAD